MAKKLTDLSSITGTYDSDIVHVVRNDTDYKELKSDFMGGRLRYSFATDADLTAQADALPNNGTFFGTCPAYGYQAQVGIPVNSGIFVCMRRYSTNYIEIEIRTIGQSDSRFIKSKQNGTWETTWTKMPTRKEQDRVKEITTIASVPTGGVSRNYSITSSTRAIVIIGGSAAERTGVWYVYSGGSGAMYIVPLVKSSNSKVDITSSQNNRFTCATTASNAMAVNIIIFSESGTITELS